MKHIKFVFIITALLMLTGGCLSNHIKVEKSSSIQYTLKNGDIIYQYNYVRPDGTNGIMYSNYDGVSNAKKPALLFITGSGCNSILMKDNKGNLEKTSMLQFFNEAGKDFWIFATEKRGVVTFDEVRDNRDCTQEYNDFITLEYRTKDNIEILKWLKNQKFIDDSKIVIVGLSEGTDVTARIGSQSKIPTHMGYFCGGGPSQMFDFVIFTRHLWKEQRGEADDIVEKRVEGLMEDYKYIFNHPELADKYYHGHTFKRWSSFFKIVPSEDLLKFDRPIFIAHGSKDESVPIESVDFTEIEFIRNNKNNLTVKKYPGLTHRFWTCEPILYKETKKGLRTTKNKNCNSETANKLPTVIQDFLVWLKQN